MEKELKELRKIIEQRRSEENLSFEEWLMYRLLYIFDLMGVKAIVVLEKVDKDMRIIESEISYAALMTFLTELFMKFPILHEKVIEAILDIKAKGLDELDDNRSIN